MTRRKNRLASALKKIVITLLVVSTVYVAALTGIIVWTFEVSLNRRPVFIHAAPFIVKTGDFLTAFCLIERFGRLGYVERPEGPLQPAQWSLNGPYLDVFPRYSPVVKNMIEGPVRVHFEGGKVTSIASMSSGKKVDRFIVEPELLDIRPAKGRPKRLCRRTRLKDVSGYLIDAIVITEDARFYTHSGIDLASIRRAFRKNLEAGRYKEGGSTIVQQLVRMTMLTSEKRLWRKFNEVCMALIADILYSKKTILEAYLNQVYFGHSGRYPVHGTAEAARIFFGVSQRDLNPAQSALLAAIIKAPNAINPFVRPVRALNRRNMILKLLVKNGKISEEQFEQAISLPAKMVGRGALPVNARSFLSLVRQKSFSGGAEAIRGQDVVTSLDPVLHRKARHALASLGAVGARAYVVIDNPETGAVESYLAPRKGAWSGASTGITPALPIALVAALRPDARKAPQFALNSQLIRPPGIGGTMTLREAFTRDPVFLGKRLTASVERKNLVSTFKEFGIPYSRDEAGEMVVGPITPLEMARIYGSLFVPGRAAPLTTLFRDRDTIGRGKASGTNPQAASNGPFFLVSYLLCGHPPYPGGPGKKALDLLHSPTYIASDDQGQWLIMYRNKLLLIIRLPEKGVSQTTLLRLAGATLPPLPHHVSAMTQHVKGIVFRRICAQTGLRATSLCPVVINEAFLKGTEPSEWCPLRHN